MLSRLWPVLATTLMLPACDLDLASLSADTGASATEPSPPEERKILEIVPGLGIGPVQLGARYGNLVEAYGEPDNLVEYKRVFFATWIELGVEVVVGSKSDEPEANSVVISIGTRLPNGFSGPVIPGMSREEADDALGPCEDVIDDEHCYHPAGVYLGYDNGTVKTVAIHRPYTPRSEPPRMQPSLATGGAE